MKIRRLMRTPIVLLPLLILALGALFLWRPWGDQPSSPPDPPVAGTLLRPDPLYIFSTASRDGTGKFYMGREISQVMGHPAINWLERRNREDQEAPSRAIAAIDLPRDAVIADIGAGSGYYTFRLAESVVPEGEVIAVDIQPEMLKFLRARARERQVTNIRLHLGTVESVELEPASIDAALFVDAYHEFSHPREMMESIFSALRPGGLVFLLEYRAEDPTVKIKRLHKMTEAQARKEMEAVGLQWSATHDFLPWQHFMIFRKPE